MARPKKVKEVTKVFDINDLESVDDIGPIRAKALKAAGIETPLDLICMSDEELMILTELDIFKCANIIEKVQKFLEEQKIIPVTSDWNKYEEYKKTAQHFASGCEVIDEMLRGGIETQAITETYGPDGAGKTQFAFSVIVEALNKGISILVLDCESTLDKDRLTGIARARGYEPNEEFFKNLHVNTVLDTSRIEKAVNSIARTIREHNVKIIIADGLIGVTRFEYTQGRGELNPRQNRLKPIIHHLKKAAIYLDVAVLITGQVQGNPDQYAGAPQYKPIGGYIMGHSAKYIINFGKKTRSKRTATFEKSNKDALQQVEFFLNAAGVSDTEVAPVMNNITKEEAEEIKNLPGESKMIDRSLLLDSSNPT